MIFLPIEMYTWLLELSNIDYSHVCMTVSFSSIYDIDQFVMTKFFYATEHQMAAAISLIWIQFR